MCNPKVVFLDWYKTLSNSLFWGHLNELDRQKITNTLFDKNRDLINPWMRGEYTSEDICDIISQETHLSFKFLFEELKKSCEDMEFVNPSLPDLVATLRSKNVKVIIATDSMDTFSRFTVPALNLRPMFDDILLSWNLTHLKEDYWKGRLPFFESFFKSSNLKYEDSILIDDRPDTTGNYEVLGFRRILVDQDLTAEKALMQLVESIK